MAASRRCMKPRATLSPDSPPTHLSAQTWAQGTLEGKSLETFEGGFSESGIEELMILSNFSLFWRLFTGEGKFGYMQSNVHITRPQAELL